MDPIFVSLPLYFEPQGALETSKTLQAQFRRRMRAETRVSVWMHAVTLVFYSHQCKYSGCHLKQETHGCFREERRKLYIATGKRVWCRYFVWGAVLMRIFSKSETHKATSEFKASLDNPSQESRSQARHKSPWVTPRYRFYMDFANPWPAEYFSRHPRVLGRGAFEKPSQQHRALSCS